MIARQWKVGSEDGRNARDERRKPLCWLGELLEDHLERFRPAQLWWVWR